MTDTRPATSAHQEHEARIARLVQQLRRFDGSRPLSLKKSAPAHQVPKLGDKRRHDDKIDISDFNHVLSIDPVARVCVCEPGVTFRDLVDATLEHGLIPIVVPELMTITVGGAVSGCSLESMSFVYGGFHDGCLAYEVVTTDGRVLETTPDNEHQLVFQMMHGSFGTLGILTRATFRLVPAKPFVKVVYETYPTLAEYKKAIRRHYEARDVDFMDGIIHARDKWVLSLGTFVDDAPYTHRYDWVTVYYRTTAKRKEDYLRTFDYVFRYDRGVTNPTPRSFLGRLLFGKLLDSDRLLRGIELLHRFIPARPGVTLDMFIPMSTLDDFFRWYDEAIGFYPLWCVPYRRVRDYEWLADGYLDGISDDLLCDIAIYGLDQPPGRNLYREIEEQLWKVKGIKTLISHNYYDPDEFWRTWNKGNFDSVKRVTDPRGLLRDVYTKMCKDSQGR